MPAWTTSLSSSDARRNGSARDVGNRVTYVENSRYAETNSLYSLWMARALLYEGFVVLNCDVLFHPVLLGDLSVVPPSPMRCSSRISEPDQPPLGDEEMKVKVRRGRVVEMSKTMDPAEADGENLGIVKFGAGGAPRLVDIMDRLVADRRPRAWAPRAFREFAQTHPLLRHRHARASHGSRSTFPRTIDGPSRTFCPQIDADASSTLAQGEGRRAPAGTLAADVR